MKIRKYEDWGKIRRSFTRRNIVKCGIGAIPTLFKRISREYELTVLICSITPQLARVCYYFVSQIVDCLNQKGIKSKTLIVDCSGGLSPHHFPNAIVEKFPNLSVQMTLDYFVGHYIKSNLVWLVDEDAFVFDPEIALEAVNSFHSDANLAAFSFRPREKWHFEIDENKIKPMGTYCLMLNREIITKEKLSFRASLIPRPLHSAKTSVGDCADFMNLQFLKKGYDVKILDEARWPCHLDGCSNATILTSQYSKDEIMEYLNQSFSHNNINFSRRLIASFLALSKINSIYSKLFNEHLPAPFSEQELKDFLNSIPTERKVKERTLRQFAYLDECENNILKALSLRDKN